jgi:indolepyruvate ferredoxin oxidoreductase alpha subunit
MDEVACWPHASALGTSRDTCYELAAALSDFPHVYAVPGYPVTHVIDELTGAGADVTWSVSEKSAVESAIGTSLCGVPAVVIMKHNGLGVAADSLANSVVHGIGAPMIVVVGDDVDASASTSSVDSRQIASAIGMIALSPSLESDVRRSVELAIDASWQLGAPVIFRITGRLHDDCLAERTRSHGPVPVGRSLVSTGHAHSLTKLSRVARAARLREAARAHLTAAGYDALLCRDGHTRMVVAVADTELPERLDCCVARVRSDEPAAPVLAAIRRHPDILVVEEGAPVIERAIPKAKGRLTGHLPSHGRLSVEMIRLALDGKTVAQHVLSNRPTDPAPAHAALFAAIGRLHSDGVFVATDVGSAIALSYPPFTGADAAVALGSPPAVAAGAARAGRPALAVIGDFGLLHSGINSLLELIADALPVVTVVIANDMQAKTGGQPLPAVSVGELLGTGAVGDAVTRVDDGWSEAELHTALSDLLAVAEPALVLYSSRS